MIKMSSRPLHQGLLDFRQAARALLRPVEKAAGTVSQHPPGIPVAGSGIGGVFLRHRESPLFRNRRGRYPYHLPARRRQCRGRRFRRLHRTLSQAPIPRVLRIALQRAGSLPTVRQEGPESGSAGTTCAAPGSRMSEPPILERTFSA